MSSSLHGVSYGKLSVTYICVLDWNPWTWGVWLGFWGEGEQIEFFA